MAVRAVVWAQVIKTPSEYSIVELMGEEGPNVSPFIMHCDDDSNEPWQHPLLGTFARNPAKYCRSECHRHIACCRPQHPDKLEVLFSLRTYNGLSYIGPFDDATFDVLLGDNDSPIAIFVHGFTNNYLQTPHFNETQRLYVRNGFNFVVVDWHIANSVYAQAVFNTRTVGAMIGYFLKRWNLQPDAICIGFSLGSHICGEAGKWLRNNKFPPIAACHMLDPAGPFFDGCDADIVQNKEDCAIVNVLHVSQNVSKFMPHTILVQGYGSRHASGNCDYWINDGLSWKQPGCSCTPGPSVQQYFVQSKSMNMAVHCVWCAHFRVLDFYLSEIKKSCRRIGVESERCGLVQECSPIEFGRKMYLPPYDACTSSMRHDFRVLTTHKEPPFC